MTRERTVVSNEPENTQIQERYAAQFAADLENNRKEQETITTKIAEHQDRLAHLQTEERWLAGMQGTLADAPAASTGSTDSSVDADSAEADSAEAPAPGVVPRPRRPKKTAGATGRSRSKAAAKPVEKAAPKAAEKKAVKKAEKKVAKSPEPGRPTLRELVTALLVGRSGEPLMVSDVVRELTETHPERVASTQVVRNALEGLVAKGSIERERKQGSVMYTALRPTTSEPQSAAAAGAEAAGPVAEAADEKAAAES
ncbi:hypothetical protein [Streptomyces jumonjinensis]|uniref:Uncharacterized protein n=1 Tax=Streptomyces jumonjinensis TaxID=1945 RepID=A0A646KPJ7_STRJU|nr:hypothetical protein [Streptomyces jumonjinensis]MQT04153.1 hypothetical protein [Streptomyces jumonjinensis]